MLSSSRTMPGATFEEYAALHKLPLGNTDVEAWRRVYEQDKLAQANAPTTIPPCPSWCSWPAGHEYDSVAKYDVEMLTYTRFHEAPVGSLTVSVHERNRDGVVTLDPAQVYVEEAPDLTLDKARVFAADMNAAVEMLDTIASR